MPKITSSWQSPTRHVTRTSFGSFRNTAGDDGRPGYLWKLQSLTLSKTSPLPWAHWSKESTAYQIETVFCELHFLVLRIDKFPGVELLKIPLLKRSEPCTPGVLIRFQEMMLSALSWRSSSARDKSFFDIVWSFRLESLLFPSPWRRIWKIYPPLGLDFGL